MLYIISRKYLDKHAAKLVAPNDYLIIDGENMGSNASGTDDPVSQKYNRCIIRGGLCPERETINLLKAKQHGREISEKKLKRQLKEFFKSVDFLEAAFFSMKAQGVYGSNNDINVFICLPTIIYKAIGPKMATLIQDISKVDFPFVRTEKDIKSSKKACLEDTLKRKQLKAINKSVKKAEEKFKIRCRDEDFDDEF